MLPNWLYGKSKSKLASILGGGGGTPADYNQVKAQVTQNTEDILSLSDALNTKAALTQISNHNLLDNPWFTVNQRGQSSYSDAGYTVDRWKRNASDVNGHTLTVGSVTLPLNNSDFYQQLLDSDCHLKANQAYTMSVIIDGNLYAHTFTAVGDGAMHYHNKVFVDHLHFNIIENWDTGLRKHLFGINNDEATQDHTITAVKLELGSVSTLAMDTAPDYTTELFKCQRYFVRISSSIYNGSTQYGQSLNGYGHSNSSGRVMVPKCMRILPNISFSSLSDFKLIYNGKSVVPTAFRVGSWTADFINVSVDISDTDLQYYPCCLRLDNVNAYIDLDADL